jgi:hypothetical protein
VFQLKQWRVSLDFAISSPIYMRPSKSGEILYVTYDLPQQQPEASHQGGPSVIRGAQKVSIPGRLIHWQIGEHETASGKKVSGVKIRFSGLRASEHPEDPSLPEHLQSATQTPNEKIEIVEVPSHATHVQIHKGDLPEEYRSALEEAA